MCELSPFLTCFGNPLLDITLVVKDTKLHKAFKLPIDGQLEVNSDQRQLFDVIMKRDDIEFSAGGCSLNSSRVFSWVLEERNKVLFVGGIGVDDKANELKNIIHESGVATRFVEVKDKPTGSCIALVLGAQRCLSADIGAAAICEPEHVFKSDILKLLDTSSIIYVEGYFITHSFNTALKVAQYCFENNKILVFNLCGSYVCENHPNELSQILPFVDILFGYIEEYRTLNKHADIPKLCSQHKTSNSQNIFQDIKSLCSFALKDKDTHIIDDQKGDSSLTNNCSSSNSSTPYLNGESKIMNGSCEQLTDSATDKMFLKDLKKRKLVVITQGPDPILYASGGKIFQKEVAPISSEEIVDTTGAGDSFVGGFLAALAKGKSIADSLECGSWTAQQLLRQRGCSLPLNPPNFF